MEVLEVFEYKLKVDMNEILHISKGYLNGLKAFTIEFKLIIISTCIFNEIKNDQVRFDQNKLTKWDN